MTNPVVEIGLATYNGAQYLGILLESLAQQSYKNWRVVARDDGSQDNTLEILNTFSRRYPGKLVLIDADGENFGPIGNFSKIMRSLAGDYFMFCDQDDVWLSDKIEMTLKVMQQLEDEYGTDAPLLVHTDLRVVDKNLEKISDSFFAFQNLNPLNANHFNRLLVENVVTGCTVLGNRKLRELTGEIPKEAMMHDWWLALVASSFGKVGFVPHSTLLYRQHGANQEGAKKYDLHHVFVQAYNVFFRRENFKFSLKRNQVQARAFLEAYSGQLDKRIIQLLLVFCDLFNQSYFLSRYNIFRYRFLITGFVRNLAFFFRI